MSFELAFYLALTILAAMVVICLTRPKRSNRMLIFTVGIWLMMFVLYFPFGPVGGVPAGNLLKKTVLIAAQAFKVFGMNVSNDYISETNLRNAPEWLPGIYCTLITVIYLAAPVITAGYLLRYVHGARSWWLFLTSRRKETWFFSAVSEKALLLAKDAMSAQGESIRVVFCGVKSTDYDRVQETEAIPFSTGVGSLGESALRRSPSTVLFMSDDDEQNLEDALKFIERHRQAPRKAQPIFVYVFTAKPEAELLLNAADKGQLVCRRIAENRTLVYAEIMAAHPAIWEAAERNAHGGKKRLTFLVVGCGWIGSELVRALIWMYGRGDCSLTIRVLDRGNVKRRFLRACPGLAAALKENMNQQGDAPLTIEFLPSMVAGEFAIESRFGDTDFAFVALGDNAKNLECAIYLRRSFRRIKRMAHPEQIEEIEDFSMPPIHAVVGGLSGQRMDFKDVSGRDYAIMPFAGKHGFYTMATMLNYSLEKLALATHLSWHGDPESRQLAEELKREDIDSHLKWRNVLLKSAVARSFYDYDYNVTSSRASAMFRQCFSSIDEETEHQRWTMYMLSEGYQAPPINGSSKIKDTMAKLHWEIRNYEELPESEKKKDRDIISDESAKGAAQDGKAVYPEAH